jgi:hypothetical protein
VHEAQELELLGRRHTRGAEAMEERRAVLAHTQAARRLAAPVGRDVAERHLCLASAGAIFVAGDRVSLFVRREAAVARAAVQRTDRRGVHEKRARCVRLGVGRHGVDVAIPTAECRRAAGRAADLGPAATTEQRVALVLLACEQPVATATTMVSSNSSSITPGAAAEGPDVDPMGGRVAIAADAAPARPFPSSIFLTGTGVI